jgi:hypothetical protein
MDKDRSIMLILRCYNVVSWSTDTAAAQWSRSQNNSTFAEHQHQQAATMCTEQLHCFCWADVSFLSPSMQQQQQQQDHSNGVGAMDGMQQQQQQEHTEQQQGA